MYAEFIYPIRKMLVSFAAIDRKIKIPLVIYKIEKSNDPKRTSRIKEYTYRINIPVT